MCRTLKLLFRMAKRSQLRHSKLNNPLSGHIIIFNRYFEQVLPCNVKLAVSDMDVSDILNFARFMHILIYVLEFLR